MNNYLRIFDRYENMIKLAALAIMFVLVYNQLIYVDNKVQKVGEKVQDLVIKETLDKPEPYTKRDLMSDMTENDKLMRVYMGSQAREFYGLSAQGLNYFRNIKIAIEDDLADAYVFGRMSSGIALKVAKYNGSNSTVEFYNKWEMPVSGDNDPWLKNFPNSPYLAFNSEIIPWPNCGPNQVPTIAAEPVRTVNSQYEFDVRVRELDKVRSWQVVFDGVDILDARAVNGMRAIVIWTCKAQDFEEETQE